MTTNLNLTLKHFDELPDAAHVRLPVVAALLGVSTASVWRRSKDLSIPAPRKLGPRTSAWNVGELRAALAQAKV
jgi:predicted DNA-binding transcriptional regulator AlpA